jgi:predicted small integral membrane protein
MKKLLYFLKIVLIQDIIFNLTFLPLQAYENNIYSNNEIFLFVIDLFMGFIYSLGISGLLFAANALCVIFIEKKIHIYLLLTLNIILYIFVFFEYVLDISGAFRELLVPTVFGVYGGVFLAMLKNKKLII